MKKVLLIISFISVLTSYAQVGIGTSTPNSDAILELSSTSKGLLLPRVALTSTTSFAPLAAHTSGMSVYNTATAGDVTPGTYYNDGTKWIRIERSTAATKSFYMPSVSVNTTALVNNQTIDLFSLYKAQFQTPAFKNPAAPSSVPFFALSSDLYYYITAYDNTVLNIDSLSDSGVLQYDVIGQATDCSFINIVFVQK